MGMFAFAYSLLEDHDLEFYQKKHIRELLDYFGKHLPVPEYFSGKTQPNAISWLKSDATEMVEKFWELKVILEEYGQTISVKKQDSVGRVLYSDQYQVVALK